MAGTPLSSLSVPRAFIPLWRNIISLKAIAVEKPFPLWPIKQLFRYLSCHLIRHSFNLPDFSTGIY